MSPITPNPFLGIGLHGVGAVCAANCYAPQKLVRRWSWQTFWLAQAFWCWLAWPLIGAWLTIPDLRAVLAEAWAKHPDKFLLSFLFSIAYGVGGTAFNVSIRYIGFSLTYAIAVGLSAVLGTLIPPLVRGQLGAILSRPGASFVIAGVVIGILGIAFCGAAGRSKERDLQASKEGAGEFSMMTGLMLSLLAGVLSAVYGFAIEVMAPVIQIAEQHGAGHWKGNVAYITANTGAFLTAAIYSLYLAKRHSTFGEFTKLKEGKKGGSLISNYLFAIATGSLWYCQFFFYNLGHVRMGRFEFASWAIHMIMLVLFSNVTGLIFLEWKGVKVKTRWILASGVVTLIASVLALTFGTKMGGG